MGMEMAAKRKYQMTRRAEQLAKTRRRIVEAAVDLHGSLGPARASYAAIVTKAGVERKTAYNHFPNEADLFRACSTHYQQTNPFPDPGPWRSIANPEDRLRTGLSALYSHYEKTERRWANILRDADIDPLVRAAAEYRFAYLTEVRDVLAIGLRVQGRRRLRLLAAAGLAVDFHMRHSLIRTQGTDDQTAIELMVGLVRQAAA